MFVKFTHCVDSKAWTKRTESGLESRLCTTFAKDTQSSASLAWNGMTQNIYASGELLQRTLVLLMFLGTQTLYVKDRCCAPSSCFIHPWLNPSLSSWDHTSSPSSVSLQGFICQHIFSIPVRACSGHRLLKNGEWEGCVRFFSNEFGTACYDGFDPCPGIPRLSRVQLHHPHTRVQWNRVATQGGLDMLFD